MSLPLNTATIIEFLRPNAVSAENFTVTIKNGVVTIPRYDEVAIGQPQPTEQSIISTGNSQAFQDYEDEHGKDPIKTRRRELRDRIVTPEERIRVAVLASITGKTRAQVRQAYRDAIAAGFGD